MFNSQSAAAPIPRDAEMLGKMGRTCQALLQLKRNHVTEVRHELYYLTALSEIFTSSLWPSTEQP